jgi:hypothetical protein
LYSIANTLIDEFVEEVIELRVMDVCIARVDGEEVL